MAVTFKGATFDTNAGNKTVTATPAVGDLIVVITAASGAPSVVSVADNNSSGAYVQVDSTRSGFSTTAEMRMWVRTTLVASAASTIFTATETGSSGGGLVVLSVSGMSRTGASAVRSSGGQSSGTLGTTPAPVLSLTPVSTSPIIAAVANGTNSTTTVTQRAGYTEDFDNGYTTPPTGLEVSHLDSGETSATITFGSTTVTAFASIAIELDTSLAINVSDSTAVSDAIRFPNITFLEPGGDATFNVAITTAHGLWGGITAAPTLATDFVHGTHVNSIQYRPSNQDLAATIVGTVADTGSRVSVYLYIVTLPAVSTSDLFVLANGLGSRAIDVRITSAGVLQLWNANVAQIGTNGATLATGQWYRVSLAYTISSTTVNRFELFVDGVSSISVTNATVTTGTVKVTFGNFNTSASLDFRSSDHYLDSSPSLLDTGDVWVTAKRPNANGTTNGFVTQIGSGGSGYGSGHSPQVNERPLSTTNGWNISATGTAVTEEYNIEGIATGDIDLTGAAILGYTGWADTVRGTPGSAGSIITDGVTSGVGFSDVDTVRTTARTNLPYPAGAGADIGVVTSTATDTFSLYELGVIVAAIPSTTRSISVTDSTTVGDAITTAGVEYINVIDSTAVSDTPTIEVFSSINKTDTTTVSDTPTLLEVDLVSVTDTTVVGDIAGKPDDTTFVFDQPTIAIQAGVTTLTISVTDSTAVSDTPTLELFSFVNVTDSSAVTDTPTTRLFSSVNVTDSTAVADTPTVEMFSFVNVTDTSTVGELVTMSGTEYVSVTDSSAVSDTPTIRLFSNLSVSDSTAVTDSPTLELFSFVNVTDSSAVTDTPTLETIEQGVSVTDSTAVSDAITLRMFSFVNVTDSTAVGEVVTLTVSAPQVNVSDSTIIGENVSLLLVSPGAINVTDSTAVSDVSTVFIPKLTLAVSDSSAVSDTPTLTVSTPLINTSDSTAVGESTTLTISSTTARGYSFVVFID